MSSKSLARTITDLERERTKLRKELDAVEAALAAVTRALNGNGSASGARARGIAAGRGGGRSAGGTSTRRAWFERDEAGSLLKKAARKPATPADLVRELARMKGYENRLQKAEMRRFQGAAFMAISQALKTGALKKAKGGLLVAG